MTTLPELLYTGTGRTVTAIDRLTGRPVWRAKLGGVLGNSISMLLVHGAELYVARGGYVYCMDRRSGAVLWERGVGNGMFTLLAIDGASSSSAVAMQAMQAQQAAASAALITTVAASAGS